MENFNKVVLWGYKLYSHTNSFVYAAFENAFKHLGYNVKWYFDDEDHSSENFDNCLFFAFEGQEKNIPLNKSSKYILHNINPVRYTEAGCKVLAIQTFNKDVFGYDKIIKLSECSGVIKGDTPILFMPWATDLLPHEFDFNLPINRERKCIWIGTHGDAIGVFQNGQQLNPFFDSCLINSIPVTKIDPWASPVSFTENCRMVRNSLVAPAIQGKWQVDNQYISCRLFKNISYGNLGITNNPIANTVFNNNLIYNSDTSQLLQDALDVINSPSYNDKIISAMKEVQENHTYINRIKTILEHLP